MANHASTILEVQTSGSDTNGGGFAPNLTNISTNLVVASAGGLTTSPAVTSADYKFISRDIGHWLYIQGGTSWKPGWYKITSVFANSAFLDAETGHVIQYYSGASGTPNILSTGDGCAYIASPTNGRWLLDYSQGTPISVSDIVATSTGTFTLVTEKGSSDTYKNFVGNILNVTSGAGFTLGRYQIVSENGSVMSIDRSWGATSGTASGKLGGSLATPGMAGSMKILSNSVFIKSGTYTITSSTPNISSGCISDTTGGTLDAPSIWEGYENYRCDRGAKPIYSAGSITTGTLMVFSTVGFKTLDNILFDGNTNLSMRGHNITVARCIVRRCGGIRFTNSAFVSNQAADYISCYASGCTTLDAIKLSNSNCIACEAYNNEIGFSIFGGSYNWCLSYNNSVAGFSGSSSAIYSNCIAYNNPYGFHNGALSKNNLINCIAENNNYGFYSPSINMHSMLKNCAYYNNSSGNVYNIPWNENSIEGSGSFFSDAVNGNFALNNLLEYGVRAYGAGFPGVYPRGLTSGNVDIGAAQHADLSDAAIAAAVWAYSNRILTA